MASLSPPHTPAPLSTPWVFRIWPVSVSVRVWLVPPELRVIVTTGWIPLCVQLNPFASEESKSYLPTAKLHGALPGGEPPFCVRISVPPGPMVFDAHWERLNVQGPATTLTFDTVSEALL